MNTSWFLNPGLYGSVFPLCHCENILCRYLYDGDLVFVIILKGISILNSPKGFWRSLPEISFFILFFVANWKSWLTIHRHPSPLHSHGSMPSKHSDILTVHQTHIFAKLHKQVEDWLRLKNLFGQQSKQKEIELQWKLFQSSWCYWQSFFWQVMQMHF